MALRCSTAAVMAAVRYKHELPNYGTFDEKRIFASGPLPEPVEFRGVRIWRLPICEDGWLAPMYAKHLAARGAPKCLISVNGSPYEIDKDDRRLEQVFAARVRRNRICLCCSLTASAGRTNWCLTAVQFRAGRRWQSGAHRLPDWTEEHLRVTQWKRGDSGLDPATLGRTAQVGRIIPPISTVRWS